MDRALHLQFAPLCRRFGLESEVERAVWIPQRGTRRWRNDLVLGWAIMLWFQSMCTRARRREVAMETTMLPKRLRPKMSPPRVLDPGYQMMLMSLLLLASFSPHHHPSSQWNQRRV
ncbi:hypothetical protein C8J57DRAFT_1477671, partial [Mycena rebaudengoi]